MPWDLWVSVLLIDGVGLTLGALALWGRDHAGGRTPLRDLLTLAVLGIGMALVAGVVARFWLHSNFGLIRLLCHVLFCVLAPLLLARSVTWLRQRHVAFGLLLLIVGAAMECVYVYARHAELHNLEVTHHTVTSSRLAGLARPIRVVVLADLQTDHIGEYERSVFHTMDELRPDLVLLAGDYLQVLTKAEFHAEQPKLRQLFLGLKHRPRLGIFAVGGDVEFGDDAALALRGTGVRYLQDDVVKLDPASRLQIVGMTVTASREAPSAWAIQQIRLFDGLTILLGHAPDFARGWIENGADLPVLCVAGHTHGGQVVIPGFGPPLTLSRVPRRYASGFHRIGAGWLLVSRGVGHERGYAPRIRMCCRPELCVVELRPVTLPD